MVLLLGDLKLILGPGVFTVFDLHKVDVPLFWKELTRVTGLGRYREFVLGTHFIGTTNIASGRLEGSAGPIKQDDPGCQCPWSKACPKRAFADTFKEDSAENIIAFSYHI
eukprot:1160913-Pelagomonas_calceolata.AAC.8